MGKIYSGWFKLGESIKNSSAKYKKAALEKHAYRWAYGHSDFTCAAYMLDPEFHSHNQLSNEEVVTGFQNVAEKVGILLEVRRRVAEEEEDRYHYPSIWKQRQKLLAEDPTAHVRRGTAFPEYPDKKTESVKTFCKAVTQELGQYQQKKGYCSCRRACVPAAIITTAACCHAL